MAVVIEVDTTSPVFTNLDPKKIRVVIGQGNPNPIFFNFNENTQDLAHTGEAGVSRTIFAVTPARPLVFANDDFMLLGNADTDAFQASRCKASLIAFMRKGVLKVSKDGAPLSPHDILFFS